MLISTARGRVYNPILTSHFLLDRYVARPSLIRVGFRFNSRGIPTEDDREAHTRDPKHLSLEQKKKLNDQWGKTRKQDNATSKPVDDARVVQSEDNKNSGSIENSKKDGFIDYSKLREDYQAPHYPIVLCHGFSGFDKLSVPTHWLPQRKINSAITSIFNIDYWHGIKESLEQLGSTVLIGRVPPFGTIEARAISLDKFINRECESLRKQESKSSIYNSDNNRHKDHSTENETFKETNKAIKVNLISHSMGGLDSRYLISKLQNNRNYKVVSLTTISTPHRGSECADFLVNLIGKNTILKSVCPKSIYELTTGNMQKFNEAVQDNPDVKYFSYGAQFTPKWFNVFNLTWRIMRYQIKLERKEIGLKKVEKAKDLGKELPAIKLDNDGMVSVESAKWGEYLGTLDQVDHLDLINWTNRTRVAIDKAVFNQEPNFNALALYLDIADNLAKKGF